MEKTIRVYVDGVYDLFHRGHVESLEKAKHIRPDVYLIVGLISDSTATGYKREPIFTDDDRYKLLKACRYVDQIVYHPPLILTSEFLERYKIDLVVHGFSDLSDLKKQQPFFEQIKDKFELLPYFPYNSTSKYISKIGTYTQEPTKPTIKPKTKQITHFHGGQDVHTHKCHVDMSVTTNGLGPLKSWSFQLADQIDHYPPIRDKELYDEYCDFLREPGMNVLFGNGATELIDLALRNIPAGDWRTNNVDVQYTEYENSCMVSGRTRLESNDKNALVTIIVNPNNPTGDFFTWDEMVHYIATEMRNNTYLIVDESMLFWYGTDWKSHSFVSHRDYIVNLLNTRNIKVIVIQSWTKIYACTGLRFGSMVVFDDDFYSTLREIQPPWSVNIVARDYMRHAWKAEEYLKETWEKNPKWRSGIIETLCDIYPDWDFYGKPFTSYIWINTKNEALAERVVSMSRNNGYPIRHGKNSYNRPTYIRLGVRNPELLNDWFQLLREHEPKTIVTSNTILAEMVLCEDMVDIDCIYTHEYVINENVVAFQEYLNKSQNFLVPTIIVSAENVLIDGHHRLELMRRMGYKRIPVTVCNYLHSDIFTHIEPEKRLAKEFIIQSALNRTNLTPKSTRHVILHNNIFVPLSILSKNIAIQIQ